MKFLSIHTHIELNAKQKLMILGIGFLCLIIATVYDISNQFNTDKETFHQHTAEFELQQKLEQKRADTILNALSEYYTSQIIKSTSNFRGFSEGLLENSESNYTIGLASLTQRTKKNLIEQQQKQLGYESFSISNSGLFKQQTANLQYAFLPISAIIPLDPKHSIYLSEDLFSIPSLVAKFTTAIQFNRSKSQLLVETNSHQIQKLVFKPIYLNSPITLSHKERLKQVRGIVFIIQPIQTNIIEQAKEFFPLQHTSIFINNLDDKFISNKLILKEDTSIHNWFDDLVKLQFKSSFLLVDNSKNESINLVQTWHFDNLDLYSLLNTLLGTLVVYLLLTTFSLTILRYTQNLQQVENRLIQILETSQDAVIITNQQGDILDWNPESERLFNYTKEEAVGHSIIELLFVLPQGIDLNKQEAKDKLNHIFRNSFKPGALKGESNKTELILHNRFNEKITAEISSSILKVKSDIEISLFIKDITYQRETEEAITKMAYYDSLTQLENRTYFKKSVDELIRTSPNSSVAIFFMDLDGFKQVNDTLGHSVGDELLKVIAKRISSSIRDSENTHHICRFGGDEFILMLQNIDANGAAHVSSRLLSKIERTIKIEEDEMQVSGSIGIAVYPQHGIDVDTLLRHADTAMYQSKASGKNTYSIYNESMDAHLEEKILIEKHLRNAIENEELSLFYQPQINLETGKVVGVEALIRWQNQVLGFVAPDRFIPIAEESQLIIKIGEWVTKSCIKQLKTWEGSQFEGVHIAMNVSAVQFEHQAFLNSVTQMMTDAGLASQLLEIELTERTVMNNVNDNIARFNQIRSNGYGLSVDDFGTGYSSLSYLKKFPLSILKIDKSFIDGIPQEEEDISIATAILNLAHSLKMNVVAEGIETKEQLLFLKNLNCNYAQGYFISRPLTINDLEAWLIKNKANFYSNHSELKQLAKFET